ncbi:MAG: SUF system NifU family Fe-S cluster assembly protein [Dehalococcoidia bacterium]
MPERESGLLDDLYRDILLDHYRNPRNKGTLDAPTCSAEGANPLCGDVIRLEVALDDGTVDELRFSGAGCSISQASASMMTQYVAGKTIAEAEHAVDDFQRMMIEGASPVDDFGDIEALVGVAKFPARVKCASLAWKTLRQALEHPDIAEPVTTDDRSANHG